MIIILSKNVDQGFQKHTQSGDNLQQLETDDEELLVDIDTLCRAVHSTFIKHYIARDYSNAEVYIFFFSRSI